LRPRKCTKNPEEKETAGAGPKELRKSCQGKKTKGRVGSKGTER